MRWILHVGPNKTGTTSVQFALHHARKQLASSGVLYPEVGIVNAAHHIYNFALSVEIEGSAPYAEALGIHQIPTLDDLIATARRQASEFACHTIILSSETMWTWPARRIHRLRSALREDKAIALLMVRPHLDRELSMWQEEVKHGYTGSVVEYLANRSDTALADTGCVLTERMTTWQAAGFEVRAIPFPSGRESPIWDILLESVGVQPIGATGPDIRLNPTSDYAASASLQRAFELLADGSLLKTNGQGKVVPLDLVFRVRNAVLEELNGIDRPRFPPYSNALTDPTFHALKARNLGLYVVDISRLSLVAEDLNIPTCLSLIDSTWWRRADTLAQEFQQILPLLQSVVSDASEAATARFLKVP